MLSQIGVNIMKIFDLTRGSYKDLYNSKTDKIFEGYIACMAENSRFNYFSRLFVSSKVKFKSILLDIPVFLVDTSMSGECMPVPQSGLVINVPENNYVSMEEVSLSDFNIDAWLSKKEGLIFKDNKVVEGNEKNSKNEIKDLLGVYVSYGNDKLIPRRIFIWMDKIKAAAEGRTITGEDKTENAVSLFHKVFCHEMAHALMDVELCGLKRKEEFTYSNDYIYRIYEEAFANSIALQTLEESGIVISKFIERFVAGQGQGYSAGWDLYRFRTSGLDQWMAIKVLFNYDVACFIKNSIKEYRYNHLTVPEVFENVSHANWIAVKNSSKKWCLIDAKKLKGIDGFKEYNSFWSFGEDGLCMVRLDQEKGYLYGFINLKGEEQIPVEYDYIYSFENNITIAKKDGRYGAIDMNNKEVIPFNLPYVDVRGFRDGRASVKDDADQWGVINTKGELIVPCENDTIIL